MTLKKQENHIYFVGKDLGTVDFTEQDFDESVYKDLENSKFKKLSVFEKHEKVHRTLFDLINESEGEVYLLPKVVAYISRLKESLPTLNIASFEFWLIHFSQSSDEVQMRIRGKIVGKCIPRSSYQNIFPLGVNAKHSGPHFSFAHISPDLDTTTASHLCFMAAFACCVGNSLHHWVIPSGAPLGSIEIDFLFRKALGRDVFRVLSRSEKRVPITSIDLLSQKNIEKKSLKEPYYNVEHSRSQKAIILVGEDGSYIGDWRDVDVDPSRSLISRFWRMLSEHQNSFHIGIISVFAKKELKKDDLDVFAKEMLKKKLADCSCSVEFTEEHRKLIDLFIKKVLQVPLGYACSYDELITSIAEKLGFGGLKKELVSLKDRPFFDGNGNVLEDRGLIVTELENVITAQKEEYKKLLQYLDTLEIAHKIKVLVFRFEPNYLSHSSDIEQIKEKMKGYKYLTVNYKQDNELFVLGVIHASDINRRTIATSSWNDFSTLKETVSRSDLEVISVIDHHKSEISTNKPAMTLVRDAQSSNSIFANLLFEINDQYSLGGMSSGDIGKQVEEVYKELSYPSSIRIMQRLMSRKDAIMQNRKNNYYISYEREIHEYLLCVFAILDDTDLLTKVTEYDVDAMCSLINRLKSLMLRKEVEVVNFDDLQKDDSKYVQKAAKKLLRTTDLHSLYNLIYKAKEDVIDELVHSTVKGMNTSFFQDTKILNDYACITQFKHFVNNARMINKKRSDLRRIWIDRSKDMLEKNTDLKLFMFMMSTISSAKELFEDQITDPHYKDEVWIWYSPECERSESLLKNFLQCFTQSPAIEYVELEIQFFGKSKELEKLCKDAILRPFDSEHYRGESHCIVIKVPQKKIVSRKAQFAPCL